MKSPFRLRRQRWSTLLGLTSLTLVACQSRPAGHLTPSANANPGFSSQNASLRPQRLPDQWIVRLQAGVSPQDYARAHQLVLQDSLGLNMYVFRATNALSMQQLARDERVQWVEPNYTLTLPPINGKDVAEPPLPATQSQMALPNDPLIPAQYGFSITGMEKVWQHQPGSPNVVVAVIDSGIDGQHPEFEGQLIEGFDFTLKTPGPGGQVDGYGHGTHVAGVIGAKTNNGQGIAGLAPGCKLMPVRIFNNWGQSESGRSAKAVIWAVDHGAKVINASWGSPMLGEASKAAYEYAIQNDVVFVAAVGNAGNEEPKYPGAVPEAIGVAATNADDRWGSFSTYGEWVDLGAPGAEILSTYPMQKGNGYRIMDGTSMAAPFVSAAAALIRSQHPDWNVAQVRQRLESTAKDVIMSGKDKYSGYGRVDIAKALETNR